MACELVCTGWYASPTPRAYRTFGDDVVRGTAFRQIWWSSIDTFVKPEAVFVVDSGSPIKPDDHAYTRTRVSGVELLSNPGHAQNCTAHYCGWMASAIMGMEYALHSGADFCLYVEQDALLYGDAFVDQVKVRLRRSDFVFGASPVLGALEQSVFAVSRRGMRRFLSALHRIEHGDRDISPEWKFLAASTRIDLLPLLNFVSHQRPPVIRRLSRRPVAALLSVARGHETLGFGYGRRRPINFSDATFYFQQASRVELAQYARLTGFNEVSSDLRDAVACCNTSHGEAEQ